MTQAPPQTKPDNKQNEPIIETMARQASRVGKVYGAIQAVGLLLLAIVVFIAGLHSFNIVEVRSLVASGKVIEVTPGSDKTSAVTYEFTVGDTVMTGRGTMPITTAIGDVIKVEYNPTNPDDNALDFDPALWGFIFVGASFLMVIGAIIIYLVSRTALGSGAYGVKAFSNILK